MVDPPPISALAVAGAVIAGKYRLESILGYGGMGAVWSATHLGLNQEVAVKLISSQLVASGEALSRFDREAKAAAQMRSRHIPQVYDNGVLADGTPYIAMELLRGESLFDHIHKKGPVPLPQAVTILSQCCRALSRAHSIGIVHRDIKPDNIFLAESVDDDGVLVKILDFGIAKLKDPMGGSQSTTRTGTLLGTPLYMSPEQARGLSSLDHRSDLYSLGLVAYTMLTGNLAFSGESFGDLLVKICTQDLPSLRAGAPWLPPPMEEWFRSACARDPNDRFATAAAFSEALQAAAGVIPSQHSPLEIPRSTERSALALGRTVDAEGAARPTLPAPSGGGAPSMASSGGTSLTHTTSGGLAGSPEANISKKRVAPWMVGALGLVGVVVVVLGAVGLRRGAGQGETRQPIAPAADLGSIAPVPPVPPSIPKTATDSPTTAVRQSDPTGTTNADAGAPNTVGDRDRQGGGAHLAPPARPAVAPPARPAVVPPVRPPPAPVPESAKVPESKTGY